MKVTDDGTTNLLTRDHDKDMLIAGFQHDIAKAQAEIERLKAALRRIAEIKPLKPVGSWGDPYAELVVSCVGIARAALEGKHERPA